MTDIILNGEPARLAAATLAEMLAELDLADAKVATALNGDFVPASARDRTVISAGDRIEIVAPMQGG